MSAIRQLLTDHIGIWTAADTGKKSGRGRSSGNTASAYGIRKLRELILELAVRGKLAPQDANDEPASALLKRIQVEKAKLIAEGKIKKDKPLAAVTGEEKPFDLPLGWEWVRLGFLSEIKGGKRLPAGTTFSICETPYIYIQVANMKNGTIIEENLKYIDESTRNTIKQYIISSGDLYITIAGTIGDVGSVPDRFSGMNLTENAAKIIVSEVSKEWLKRALGSSSAKRQFSDKAIQMAQPKLALHRVADSVLALPPLAEQHRIVAKVDELMALCDQLESHDNIATEAHEKLVSHLLGTLTQSQSADDFSANWQRIAAHFDALFTTEPSIDALKQTLLQLAVMGKLVRQDPKDEPASALLKRIPAEKAKLISQGKIKKGQPLPLISEEERPFRLHDKWGWCRFDDLWESSFYGPRFGKEDYVNFGGIPTIRTTDMTSDGLIELDSPPEVLVPEEKIDMYQIKYGDLLVTRSGSIGTMALFLLDMVAIPSAYLIRIRFLSLLDPKYGLLYLMSPLGQHFLGLNSTSVGVPNVNATKMASFPFPLPPLLEQHRIVVKVDELMALCEQLKSRITDASQLQQKLAGVMVERAVA